MERTHSLANEMALATFADGRLSNRLGRIVQRLVENPGASFPNAMPDTAELEGAYRFFGNPVVTPDGILSGHFAAVRERCEAEPSVLVVHDTSTFRYSAEGKRKGLGRLASSGQTFFGHVALAVSDDGLRRPLGVVGLTTWVRPDRGEPVAAELEGHTLDNERTRWNELVVQAGRMLQNAHVIHLMDREADDYTLFTQMLERGDRFIVRERHNRLLVAQEKGASKKLHGAVMRIEAEVDREAKLSKRVDGKRSPLQKQSHPSRPKRMASLAVGATTVTLKRSKPLGTHLPKSVTLNVVRVWEPNPPHEQAPIEWVLYTTESISTTEDLLRIVDRYRTRWVIEEFFKALKTGCAFQSRQLDNYEALINALAVFAPIAVDLLSLRSRARETPDAPASDFMPAAQLEVLRVLGPRRLPPNATLGEAMLALAALGGHIKWSGPPGWLTTTRGYLQLLQLTRGWEAAKLQYLCDQR